MTSIEERAEQKVNDMLMHHGIQGQKWGVRHGPPYPLDSKTSSNIKKGEEVKSKNNSSNKEQISKDANSLMDEMTYWWEGYAELTDTKQWNNFMSDETYKKVEEFVNSGQVSKNPAGDVFIQENIILAFNETMADGIDIPRTETDKKIFNSVVEKYPESEYNYSRPKFEGNKLKGFETQAEKLERERAEKEAHDKDPGVQRIRAESKIASLADQLVKAKEKGERKLIRDEIKMQKRFLKTLKHSALYEIVDDVLEHHGIEGQKWGIKHGPPYPLDRKTSKAIKKSGKVTVNVKDLSDDDLRRIISRLQMEKQLKELTKEDTKKAETYVSKSLKNLRDKMTNTVFDIISDSLKTVSKYALNKKLKAEVKKEKDS